MSACRRRGSTATAATTAAATPPLPTRAATATTTTTTKPTTSDNIPFTPDELHDLYTWVDGLPLSRPKRHIARDFADGCCVAELMHHFFPRLVELHNYTPAMGQRQKRDNWRALNTRVFRRLCFDVPSAEVDDIVAAVPGAIERFLRALRIKIAQIQACRRRGGNNNEEDDRDDGSGGDGGARVAGRIAMSRATASTDAAAATTRNDDNNDDGKDANGNAHMMSARQRRVASRSLSPTARRGSAQTMTRTIAAPRHTDARDVHCSVRHRSLYDVVSPSQPRHVDAAASVAATDNNNKKNNATAADDDDHDKDDDSALRGKQHTVRLLLAEKDRTIVELRETVGILSEKIAKLEELVRVKDDKLSQYRSKFGRM